MFKRIGLAMVFCLLVGLIGCRSGYEDATSSGATTEAIQEDSMIEIVKNNTGNFVILVDKSNLEQNQAAIRLRNELKYMTGVSLEIFDIADAGSYNNAILLGTLGSDLLDSYIKNLKDHGYGVFTEKSDAGVKIVLCGMNNTRLTFAVSCFIEECIQVSDGNVIMDDTVSVSRSMPLDEAQEKGYAVINALRMRSFSSSLSDPENEHTLSGIRNVRLKSILTGDYSKNETLKKYGFGGTDIGAMFNKGERTYILFGDSFRSNNQVDDIFDNALAFTDDTDFTNGIEIDGFAVDETGKATALVKGKRVEWDEIAIIPTGGIVVGDNLYMFYMSVIQFVGGDWNVNYCGVAKSTDDGQTWTAMPELRWAGDTNFGQIHAQERDGYIYVMGVKGGRSSSPRLARVLPEKFEDFDAYEYLVGVNEDGTPIFESGKEALYNEHTLFNGTCGEFSFMYSEYLQEWIMMYCCNMYANEGYIVMRTAKELWGSWSNEVVVVPQSGIPETSVYSGQLNSLWVLEDGSRIGFLMSMWTLVYNIVVMEIELEKNKNYFGGLS